VSLLGAAVPAGEGGVQDLGNSDPAMDLNEWRRAEAVARGCRIAEGLRFASCLA